MSWGDRCPGGTLVQGDKCRGDTCPGGHLSRGTNVGGTVVGGTNVTPPYYQLFYKLQPQSLFEMIEDNLSLVLNILQALTDI